MSLNTLDFRKVHFAQADVSVFRDFTWQSVDRRIGVIGANGSGKTTFARLLTGLISPDQGQVTVHDVDVGQDRKAALRTIGMIFQNPDHQIIFPSCEEEVAFGLTQLGQDKTASRANARAALAQFGREDWAERATHMLSQGQRHLLCLISVLAMEPKVLVLDEPFAGLDLSTTIQLHRCLHALDQQIVLVTHDLTVLGEFDRVLWLDKGQIAQDGPPDLVIPAYQEEMTKRADWNA